MAGATRVVGEDGLDDALDGARLVVLALALTPATTGILDRRRLELLAPGRLGGERRPGRATSSPTTSWRCWPRGASAAPPSTSPIPEPLPDGHPLWDEPRCIITPHTGNTFEMAIPLLTERVRENVRRRLAGEPLLGPVDPEAGY